MLSSKLVDGKIDGGGSENICLFLPNFYYFNNI